MKRSLPAALVAVLLSAGCQSGRPKTGSAVPAGRDPLRPYVGDVRVLRGKADEKSFTVSTKQRLSGECDMAVRVRSAGFQKGGALFTVETIGRPAVAGREPRCRTVQPVVQLLVAALTPASGDVATRVDAVLQTPEAYLASKGVTFDRPAAEMGKDIASPDVHSAAPEAVLGRKVKTWPKVLLSVNPYVHDASGRIRQESESVVQGGKFRPTLVRLAKLANVPIVPAVVLGGEQYKRILNWAPIMRTKYGVIYGEPFSVEDEEQGERRLAQEFQGLYAELRAAMGRA